MRDTDPPSEGRPEVEPPAAGLPDASDPWRGSTFQSGDPTTRPSQSQPAWPPRPDADDWRAGYGPSRWGPGEPPSYQPPSYQPPLYQPPRYEPGPPQPPPQQSWPGYAAWPPAAYGPGYGPAPAWQAAPSRPSRLGLVAGIVVAVLFAFGTGIAVDRGLTNAVSVPGVSAAAPSGAANGDPLPGFDIYRQALQLINQKYVNRSSVTDQQLLYGSIGGLVDSLGDTGHSTFLTPDQAKREQQQLSGKLTGIGVVGSGASGTPTVVRVLPGSPAEKSGLEAGDVIQAVNGASTDGKSFNDIASQIRGPAGTSVDLTVLHPGSATAVDIKVTRAVIQIPLVDWAMVPGTKTAFIALFEFSQGASDDVKSAIAAAQKAGATGLILDLRGNPGGYVDEAVNVASQFLPSGNVYLTADASGKQTAVPVNSKQTRTGLPLVVLVDHDSASASEIVSGALQDAHRAQVVGARTFGTGTVLQEFTLKDGSVLRLGVSNFLTPAGRKIFGNGITPDHEVALPSGVVPAEPTDIKSMTPDQVQQTKDAQLLEALSLLPK